MIDFGALVPGETDHAYLSGKTGSGKSFAARQFLAWVRKDSGEIVPRTYWLAWDAKGLLRWPEAVRVTTFRDLFSKAHQPEKFPRLIYAPTFAELGDRNIQNAFFKLAYERGNNTVYVDEVVSVCEGAWKQGYPEYYHAILTRGREMHVPIISATQEPTNHPPAIVSQSDVTYTFQQKMPQHRKKLAEIIPIEAELLTPQALKKEYFYFYRDGDDTVSGPHHLKVKRT